MKGSAQLALGTVSTVLALAVGFAVAVTLAGCRPGVTASSATAGIVATVKADLAAGKSLEQMESDVAADLNADVSPAVDEVLDVVLASVELTDKLLLGDKADTMRQWLLIKAMKASAARSASFMSGYPVTETPAVFSR